MEEYDQVLVTGTIYGTNGFFTDPPPMSPNLPFPSLLDLFRYHRSSDLERSEENVRVMSFTYCEKSFGRADTISRSVVHHFVFDDLDRKDVSYWRDRPPVLYMIHYQYLSMLGVIRKRTLNGNFDITYNRPRDVLLNEVYNFTIEPLFNRVMEKLHKRVKDGYWKSLPRGTSPIYKVNREKVL